MKTLYLHIGSPKTGTTTIQHFCIANQDTFIKKGYCFPSMPFHYKFRANACNGFFLTGKYIDDDGQRNRQKEEENFNTGMKILEDTFLEYNNIILTDEGIWNNFFLRKGIRKKSELILESAKRCGYQIKIVVYLRRQADYVLSWYNQLIKHSASKKLNCLSWEEYINNYNKYIAVDYNKYLRQLEKFFGKENIIVRRFEKKHFYNNSLTDDFLYSIGLQKDEDFIDSEEISSQNFGISENACDIKRIINQIEGIELDENKEFEYILRKHSKDFKNSDNYSMMSDDEIEKFMKTFETANQKIADRYFNDGAPLFETGEFNKIKWSPNNPDYLQDAIRYMCILHLDNIRKIKEQQEQICILTNQMNILTGGLNNIKHPFGWVKKKCKHVLQK